MTNEYLNESGGPAAPSDPTRVTNDAAAQAMIDEQKERYLNSANEGAGAIKSAAVLVSKPKPVTEPAPSPAPTAEAVEPTADEQTGALNGVSRTTDAAATDDSEIRAVTEAAVQEAETDTLPGKGEVKKADWGEDQQTALEAPAGLPEAHLTLGQQNDLMNVGAGMGAPEVAPVAVSNVLQPDRAQVVDFLAAVGPDDGQFEIAGLKKIAGRKTPQVEARHFNAGDYEAAADFALELNAKEFNTYGGMAQRLGAPPSGRAKTEHVAQMDVLWADADDPGAAHCGRDWLHEHDLHPIGWVVTGRVPHLRAQAWFKLDAPVAAERGRAVMQRLIAATGADPQTHDPSRLMRLPGLIAWPSKPGRVAEMTFWAEELPNEN